MSEVYITAVISQRLMRKLNAFLKVQSTFVKLILLISIKMRLFQITQF